MASKKGATPRRIQPQLVTLVGRPPSGEWLFETKFDGYRLMARLNAGVTLITKNGYDWTNRMPSLAQELSGLPVRGVWLDGEIVALDVEGRPAFQPLQLAFSQRQTDDLIYFAFDLLYMDGTDLRPWPVEQRRELLQVLLQQCDLEHVRFSPTLEADPASLLASACQLGLEGLVSKHRGSVYSGQRNGDWIKLKCNNRQEFVVLGYTRAGAGIGSLLIGLHDDDGQLQYAGRVHSGFGGRQADQVPGQDLPGGRLARCRAAPGIDAVPEVLARLESHRVACPDLHRLACLRILASACSPMPFFESAEADQRDRILVERSGDRIENRVEYLVGLLLGEIGPFGDSGGEIWFAHV